MQLVQLQLFPPRHPYRRDALAYAHVLPVRGHANNHLASKVMISLDVYEDNDSILRTAMVTHMIAAKVHLGLHSEQARCLVLCLGMQNEKLRKLC